MNLKCEISRFGKDNILRDNGILFYKKLNIVDFHNFINHKINNTLSDIELDKTLSDLKDYFYKKDINSIKQILDEIIIPCFKRQNFGSSIRYLMFYPYYGIESYYENNGLFRKRRITKKWIHPNYYYFECYGNLKLINKNKFNFSNWINYDFIHVIPKIKPDTFFSSIIDNVISTRFMSFSFDHFMETSIPIYISKELNLI